MHDKNQPDLFSHHWIPGWTTLPAAIDTVAVSGVSKGGDTFSCFRDASEHARPAPGVLSRKHSADALGVNWGWVFLRETVNKGLTSSFIRDLWVIHYASLLLWSPRFKKNILEKHSTTCPYHVGVKRAVGRHRGGHAALLSVDAAAAHRSTWWVQRTGGGWARTQVTLW